VLPLVKFSWDKPRRGFLLTRIVFVDDVRRLDFAAKTHLKVVAAVVVQGESLLDCTAAASIRLASSKWGSPPPGISLLLLLLRSHTRSSLRNKRQRNQTTAIDWISGH